MDPATILVVGAIVGLNVLVTLVADRSERRRLHRLFAEAATLLGGTASPRDLRLRAVVEGTTVEARAFTRRARATWIRAPIPASAPRLRVRPRGSLTSGNLLTGDGAFDDRFAVSSDDLDRGRLLLDEVARRLVERAAPFELTLDRGQARARIEALVEGAPQLVAAIQAVACLARRAAAERAALPDLAAALDGQLHTDGERTELRLSHPIPQTRIEWRPWSALGVARRWTTTLSASLATADEILIRRREPAVESLHPPLPVDSLASRFVVAVSRPPEAAAQLGARWPRQLAQLDADEIHLAGGQATIALPGMVVDEARLRAGLVVLAGLAAAAAGPYR